jgi:release factor glutamine methyltransferase
MTLAVEPLTDRPLLRLPGVYPPQEDTLLLARALDREDMPPGTEVLDIGTGSGVLALRAACPGVRVTAVDRDRRAVLTARLNARRFHRRVRVRRGDLFAAVADRTFDLIVSNPPYVPAPLTPLPRRRASRAWDAGQDGRAVLDRLCDGARRMLRPHGVLLMAQSGLCGIDETLHRLAHSGLSATVHDRTHIPFGPVLRSRTAWLRRTGLIDGTDQNEELVIIRAQQP